jgi:hypothetical protein
LTPVIFFTAHGDAPGFPHDRWTCDMDEFIGRRWSGHDGKDAGHRRHRECWAYWRGLGENGSTGDWAALGSL